MSCTGAFVNNPTHFNSTTANLLMCPHAHSASPSPSARLIIRRKKTIVCVQNTCRAPDQSQNQQHPPSRLNSKRWFFSCCIFQHCWISFVWRIHTFCDFTVSCQCFSFHTTKKWKVWQIMSTSWFIKILLSVRIIQQHVLEHELQSMYYMADVVSMSLVSFDMFLYWRSRSPYGVDINIWANSKICTSNEKLMICFSASE